MLQGTQVDRLLLVLCRLQEAHRGAALPIAQARNQVKVVACTITKEVLVLHFMDTVKALAQGLIAHSQNLINQEDIRASVDRNGESQTRTYRGVELHLGVDKSQSPKRRQYRQKQFDLLFTHAKNCAVEKNIFTARQVRGEARTNFNEAGHASAVSHRASSG